MERYSRPTSGITLKAGCRLPGRKFEHPLVRIEASIASALTLATASSFAPRSVNERRHCARPVSRVYVPARREASPLRPATGATDRSDALVHRLLVLATG